MIELRWAVPPHTTTEKPRLQYRQMGIIGESGWGWSEWRDVPRVVVMDLERRTTGSPPA